MGEKEGGEKKKEEGPVTVVLNVDMHCEGCVKKIVKSVRKFEGVEHVQGDMASNKLTVKGKVDPGKLREKLEDKTKKKVELVSPQPKKDNKEKEAGGGDNKKKDEEKKGDVKKSKEPAVSTVVFKIRLHCEGCIVRIRKIISKFKGVDKVEIDTQKDLVTVKGTMDIKDLQSYLQSKLRRSVDIVPPKKEGGDKKEGEKKGDAGDGGEKKGDAGDGGDKKAKGGGDGGEKKADGGKVEANKMEHYGYGYGHGYGYANGYAVEYVHAPQIFSDENPNACSVM